VTGYRPSVRHLAGRFWSVALATPLTPREQTEVHARLESAERLLFWTQSPADQRHGLECARRIMAIRPDDPVVIRAALLHDVGKRHAGLGAVGRTCATLAGRIGWAGPAAWRRYRNHGPLGAADLEVAGSADLIVEFARRHPGPPPDGMDPGSWADLLEADDD
jgi:hypothetical protein